MDKQLCKLYSESSRKFAQNTDVNTEQKIELLANLAVMELQFTIDVNDILSTDSWEQLDYSDEAEFIECRESFAAALATLFFLCEELGDKLPLLKLTLLAATLEPRLYTVITCSARSNTCLTCWSRVNLRAARTRPRQVVAGWRETAAALATRKAG
jgi:hypothetical protein